MKPLLKSAKQGEQMEELESKLKKLQEDLGKEEAVRKEMEDNNSKLIQEKNDLFMKLEEEKNKLSELEEKLSKVDGQRGDLDKQVAVSKTHFG